MPISLYHGEEQYQLQLAVKALRKQVVSPETASLCHKKLNKPSVQAVLETVGTGTLSLLGGTTLIEIQDFEPLHKSADANDVAALQDALTSVGEDKHVLFVSTKVNRTVKFAKWLTGKKIAVDVKTFKPLAFWETDKAVQFLMSAAVKQNAKIVPEAAALLVEQYGVELQTLMNELEKLSVYTAGHPITRDVVMALSNHNENTFQMLEDWIHQRRQAGLVHTLDEILLKQHPVQLFALIQTYLNNIFQLRFWQGMRVQQDEMAQRLKKHPFKVQKDLQNFASVPFARLEMLKQKALTYEWQSKSGQLDSRLALELLLGT